MLLTGDDLAADRKPGFFTMYKHGDNFNRRNTWKKSAVRLKIHSEERQK